MNNFANLIIYEWIGKWDEQLFNSDRGTARSEDVTAAARASLWIRRIHMRLPFLSSIHRNVIAHSIHIAKLYLLRLI